MEIYCLDIRAFSPHWEEALALVSGERRALALRQPTEDALLRSLAGGVLLRRFLGDAPLSYGPHGKPFLPGGPGFSLSHGGELAVLALDGGEVGVDVESARRPWRTRTAERMFRPEERAALRPGDGEGFFTLWTRKEAVLKCCGEGLRLSPASFSVLDGKCSLGGVAYHLQTHLLSGHVLSAASLRPSPARPRLLSWEELLGKEMTHAL